MRFIVLFLLIIAINSYGQNKYQYLFVDETPEFFEVNGKLQDYIYKKIKWPYNFSGSDKIRILFCIDEKGIVKEVEILSSNTKLFDKQIIQIFENMPRWKPGKIKSKPVKVQLFLELIIKIVT